MLLRLIIAFFFLFQSALTLWAADDPEPGDKMLALMAEEEKKPEKCLSAPGYVLNTVEVAPEEEPQDKKAWLWLMAGGLVAVSVASWWGFGKNKKETPQELEPSPEIMPKTELPAAKPQQDLRFVSLADEILQKHLGDPGFNVEAYCYAMNMSKSHFYRKFQETYQQSPGKYIRQQRLEQARDMLQRGEGNVSEVAYAVGFNNLSYFAKCFRKEYGVAPSKM